MRRKATRKVNPGHLNDDLRSFLIHGWVWLNKDPLPESWRDNPEAVKRFWRQYRHLIYAESRPLGDHFSLTAGKTPMAARWFDMDEPLASIDALESRLSFYFQEHDIHEQWTREKCSKRGHKQAISGHNEAISG